VRLCQFTEKRKPYRQRPFVAKDLWEAAQTYRHRKYDKSGRKGNMAKGRVYSQIDLCATAMTLLKVGFISYILLNQ